MANADFETGALERALVCNNCFYGTVPICRRSHSDTSSAGAQNAVWGGLMTAGAQARGVLGAVVSGRVRDVTEHRAAGFTVFSRGTSTVGQAQSTRVAEVQVPVVVNADPQQLGGLPVVTVSPGDLLIADENGVVCVPKALEKNVLKLASNGREADAGCLKDIQSGLGVAESFRRHRGKL